MIKLSLAQLDRLLKSKISFSYDRLGKPWIEEGIQSQPGPDIYAEDYATYATRTHFFSIGAFSYSGSALPRFVTIGRYCSIAAGIEVLPNSHPTNLITTSSMVYDEHVAHRVRYYDDQGYPNNDGVRGLGHPTNEKPIVIGNDVYIAAGAKLRAGISVGDGAIIGAYAMVTKDVAPYSVVVGNPAQVVRMRYSHAQIATLRDTRWWDWDFKSLLENTDIKDVDRFADQLGELKAKDAIAAFSPGKNYLAEMLSNP